MPVPGTRAERRPELAAAGALGRVRMALPAFVLLTMGGLLMALLISGARAKAQSDTDAAVRAHVAQSVTQVSAAIRGQIDQAAKPTSASTTIPAPDLATPGGRRTSLIEARDSGAPTLDDTATPAAIVVPVYGSAQPPQSTQARREAITGYRIVPLALALGPVLAELAPAGGGLVVRGPSRAVAAEPAPATAGSRSFAAALDLGDASGWTLQGWLPGAGIRAHTWVQLPVLLTAFVALAVAATYLQRSTAASRAQQRRLEREAALVTGLAPVVQSSLDLGEVVPAASSHLVAGLNLAGLSLSIQGETGERPLFSWGTTPVEGVKPVTSPPAQLAPGQTYAVALARGGRLLGVLRVVAGAPLARTDLRALEAASEFLGSTLANAEAFARQQAAVERLRSVDELKSVFLATASHELRTPVTAIVGFATLLLEQWEDGDSDMDRTFLERVLANARSLETVTENLLDFSRLERGIKPSADELMDLGATIRELLGEHPELATEHHLVLDLPPGCMVRGSSLAATRIVTNLVGNAAKYTPADTTITVAVRPNGDSVELLVDDEGPGVPEADRDRVFSLFYRGHGDEVVRTAGTGVGLAIVAEFAALMSGTAQVQTAPTGGARFSVSFPAVSFPAVSSPTVAVPAVEAADSGPYERAAHVQIS